MYVIFFLVLLLASLYFLVKAKDARKSWTYYTIGYGLLILDFTIFLVMSVYVDYLWFESLGFQSRFIEQLVIQFWAFAFLTSLGIGLTHLLQVGLPPNRKHIIRNVSFVIPTLIALVTTLQSWSALAKFFYQEPAGVKDPVFGLDLSFYLFTLPFINIIGIYIFVVLLTSFLMAISLLYNRRITGSKKELKTFLVRCSGSLLLFLAFFHVYLVFTLFNSKSGVVHGMGWTDLYVRTPAFGLLAVTFAFIGLHYLFARKKHLLSSNIVMSRVVQLGAGWLVLAGAIPFLVQTFYVAPNEITLEERFLKSNIEFTRKAYSLDNVTQKRIHENAPLSAQLLKNNQDLFDEVRLWDWKVLSSYYKQFQEIRLYYKFNDIDVDRYDLDGQYRQVMISGREINLADLPARNKNFVNKRIKYTHGHGAVLSSVHDTVGRGVPKLILKDIPPTTIYESLKIDEPSIYYGTTTNEHVITNTTEEELLYPHGNNNVYGHYKGTGGIKVGNFFRKVALGWRLDGTKFLLSSYVTPESKTLIYRNIKERVNKVAPFLHQDNDPYLVISDGQLFWIVDTYTYSKTYPYSEPVRLSETFGFEKNQDEASLKNELDPKYLHLNYIRNSVKATVNALNGEVKLYVFNSDDPVLKTWKNIFPDLFSDKESMSSELAKHIRYPNDFLLAQGSIYTKYHMTDVDVFYNQEDLWTRSTEKYRDNVVPIEPYYIMWRSAKSEPLEFISMLPFSPKGKDLLGGWLAGRCDRDNYGELISYKFSKKTRVLGPQQVETKIDQNPELSQKLSLWDQRGSEVVRGNLLAIPVENTVVYIEPIYIQAEAAPYPELRLVIAMSGNHLGYGESLDAALENLLDSVQKEKQLFSLLKYNYKE